MKKLLITGFDPFGGESVNPAWEAVRRLPDTVGPYALTRIRIPTVFGSAADAVLAAAEPLRPDVILCVGQAGTRDAVTPERVAINLMDARICDNQGNQPVETPCIPGKVSLTAGAFVCNDTLYRLLHHYHGTPTRVGFIHVPYLPEQAKEGIPSLPLSNIIKAITVSIESIG